MIDNPAITFIAEEQTLLRSLDVELVVLFGSHVQQIGSETSDYDIGILLSPKSQLTDRKTLYNTLYDLLAPKINKLVDIDIVFLSEAPLELQFHVSKYGLSMYERTSQSLARYREQVMNLYADFAPLRRIFQEATLARIAQRSC